MQPVYQTILEFDGSKVDWHFYLRQRVGKCELEIEGVCTGTADAVHHIDGDHYNDEMSNVVVICRACHNSIHWKGCQLTESHKQNIAANHVGFIGRQHTEESKTAIGSANSGSTPSDEARAKMSEAGKRKIFTLKHKKNLSEARKRYWANKRKENQ